MSSTRSASCRPFGAVSAVLSCAVLLAGCAKESAPPPAAGPISRDSNLLVVYVACSLEPDVQQARDVFLAANEGKRIDITSDEPSSLVARVQNGEVPDLVVCPGDSEIGVLEQDGYLDRSTRQSMGALRLVIVVPRGNPAQIHGVKDLAADRVRSLAVATPGLTSPGTVAKRELERAGLWSQLQPKVVMKQIPYEALRAVSSGEVQAALLYDPCLRAGLATAGAGGDSPTDAVIDPASLEFVGPVMASEDRVSEIQAECHKRSPNSGLARIFARSLQARIDSTPALEETEAPPEPGTAETP